MTVFDRFPAVVLILTQADQDAAKARRDEGGPGSVALGRRSFPPVLALTQIDLKAVTA